MNIRSRLKVALIGLAVFAPPALAQPVVSLLLREGEAIDTGMATYVAAIRSTAVNPDGGYAALVAAGDGTPNPLLYAVWGTFDPASGPQVLLLQGRESAGSGFLQVLFEDDFGLSSTGQVAVSSIVDPGSCSPMHHSAGFIDSTWVNGALLGLEGVNLQTDAMAYWRDVSFPGVTASGSAYWRGGTAASPGGAETGNAVFVEGTGSHPSVTLIRTGMVPTGVPTSMGSVSRVRSFAVGTLGGYALGIAEMTGTSSTGNKVLVRGQSDTNGAVSLSGVAAGTALIQEGGPIGVYNALPQETFRSFGTIRASEQNGSSRWCLAAITSATSTRNEIILSSTSGSPVISLREGDTVDRVVNGTVEHHVLNGSIEHLAINQQGDIASVWRLDGTLNEGLVVNHQLVLVQGDQLPLTYAAPQTMGTLSNFLGTNTVSLSNRDTQGHVQIYIVGHVISPGTPPDILGYDNDDRIQTVYSIDVAVTTSVTPCRADWNADGMVNSGDYTAFLTAWFGDLSASPQTTFADFNGDGSTTSQDISAFLNAWFVALSNGC